MKNELIKKTIFCVEYEYCPGAGMTICDCTMGNSMNLNTNKDVFNERGEL